MTGRAYQPEKRTEARRLYRDGQAIDEISDATGISRNAVHARVSDLSQKRKRGPRPKPTIPDDVIVRIRDVERRLWKEIAAEANRSVNTAAAARVPDPPPPLAAGPCLPGKAGRGGARCSLSRSRDREHRQPGYRLAVVIALGAD
jgi:hypothetical protein